MSEPTGNASVAGDDVLLASLTDDFAARIRAGEHPKIEEYVERHPALAARIRQVLPTIAMIEQRCHLDFGAVGEGPGSTIGRYKLLERIGEGGFGVVYMAEQQTPVRRKVALKVIKPGVDTKQVIARFEAERQALALMDHDNIAKVLDAGATETGRPYFVMELVHGVPITEYCDANRHSPRVRLELFIRVCRAVQHAHQKGVIHRDIKPANVLVTMHDGLPVPKVIDFGVAKATGQQQLAERTLFTHFAQMVGTPLYMSPEQAEMTSVDVDTRSDVYSLGVLLYELLTGTTPFDKDRLKQAAYDEVRRIIREEEPPRPSTRISTMGEQAQRTISAQRRSDPKHLGRLVRGDLDWIVMKALEKERSRRYETANGLARDVERYLADEAVEACPPSKVYRLRKFARRNRGTVLVLSAVMAVLLILVTVLAVSNRLIAASRNEAADALREKELALWGAEAQRRRAEANFLKARNAVREALLLPAQGRGEWAQLPPSLRRKFEQDAANYYSSLLQDDSLDPSLRYETGVGLRSLGYLYQQAEPARAEELLRQSIRVLEALHRDVPDRAEYRQQLASSYLVLSSLLQESGRADEAEVAAARSTELYGRSLAERREVVEWYVELALLRVQDGRIREAADLYTRAAKIYPDDHRLWYHLAALYLALGDMERYRGACGEMLDRFDKLAAQDPMIAERTAKTCALAVDSVRDFSQVERLAQRSVTGTERHGYYRNFVLVHGLVDYRAGRHEQALQWLDRFAPNTNGTHWDAFAYVILAMVHHHRGQADVARTSLGTSRAIIARKPKDAMPGPFWFDWLHSEILSREAAALIGNVSPEELAAARQQKWNREIEDLSRSVEQRPADAEPYCARGIFLFQSGRFREAVADLDKSIELDPANHAHLHRAAAVYLYCGDEERYRGACRALVACAEKYPPEHAQAAEIAAKTCALAPDSVTDFWRVEQLAQRAVTGTEDDRYYRLFALAKGLAEFRAGRDEQAVEWLQRFAPGAGGAHWDASAFAALAMAHHRRGHTNQAREALDSAREISAKKPRDWITTGPWLDWLHCEILVREAERTLAK